jgi:hypothetical protein
MSTFVPPLLTVPWFAIVNEPPPSAPTFTWPVACSDEPGSVTVMAPVPAALPPMSMAPSAANWVPASTVPAWLTSIVPWPARPTVMR